MPTVLLTKGGNGRTPVQFRKRKKAQWVEGTIASFSIPLRGAAESVKSTWFFSGNERTGQPICRTKLDGVVGSQTPALWKPHTIVIPGLEPDPRPPAARVRAVNKDADGLLVRPCSLGSALYRESRHSTFARPEDVHAMHERRASQTSTSSERSFDPMPAFRALRSAPLSLQETSWRSESQ